MQEHAPLSPWNRVLRYDLKSGFAYPVNKGAIAAALRGGHASVAERDWPLPRDELTAPRSPASG